MPGPLALLGWYVKTLILPYPLCRERLWTDDTVWDVLGAAYFALLWFFRRRPRPLFATLFIGACCLPYLRIVPFASSNAVADRYVYGPSAGFSLLLSLLLAQGRAVFAFYGIALAWACQSVARDALYTDRRGLCEQTVACSPGHPRAHAALARELIRSDEFTEAKAEALKALSLEPRFAGAYNLLGIAEFNLGDVDGAQSALDKAVVFDPESAEIRNNVANVLLERGFEDEALENYEAAVRLRPDWDLARKNAAELRAKIAAEPKTVSRRRRAR
jgi:tetratricopeptide (TPR) repeat protein